MKTKSPIVSAPGPHFLKAAAALGPIAHGTLSFVRKPCTSKCCKLCKSGERHPAWNFAFRKDGKFHLIREKRHRFFQWVEPPEVEAENNLAERRIRPIVTDSRGGRASGNSMKASTEKGENQAAI